MQIKSNTRLFLGLMGVISFFLSLIFLIALLFVQPFNLPVLPRLHWVHSVTISWLGLSLGGSAILISVFHVTGRSQGVEPARRRQPSPPQSSTSNTAPQKLRDAVWVCPYSSSPLSRQLNTEQDLDIILELLNRYERGEVIDPSKMPKSFILGGKQTPADIMISGFLFVSDEVSVILRCFNLGKNSLVKLDGVYRGREKKPLSQGYSILTQENRKDAFSAIDSEQQWIRQMSKICPQWGMFVSDAPDDAFAVTKNAMNGPDIWRDPAVPQQLFLSDRLKVALDLQGIGHKLGLKRCRVVPSKV